MRARDYETAYALCCRADEAIRWPIKSLIRRLRFWNGPRHSCEMKLVPTGHGVALKRAKAERPATLQIGSGAGEGAKLVTSATRDR